jgi:hypothetical protein
MAPHPKRPIAAPAVGDVTPAPAPAPGIDFAAPRAVPRDPREPYFTWDGHTRRLDKTPLQSPTASLPWPALDPRALTAEVDRLLGVNAEVQSQLDRERAHGERQRLEAQGFRLQLQSNAQQLIANGQEIQALRDEVTQLRDALANAHQRQQREDSAQIDEREECMAQICFLTTTLAESVEDNAALCAAQGESLHRLMLMTAENQYLRSLIRPPSGVLAPPGPEKRRSARAHRMVAPVPPTKPPTTLDLAIAP